MQVFQLLSVLLHNAPCIFKRRQLCRWSAHTLLLLPGHTLVACAECVLALSYWDIHTLPKKRHCLDGSICLQDPNIRLTIYASHPWRGHRCTPLLWQTVAFALFADSSVSLAQRSWCPYSPKTSWNRDSSDHRTHFHFLSVSWTQAHGILWHFFRGINVWFSPVIPESQVAFLNALMDYSHNSFPK